MSFNIEQHCLIDTQFWLNNFIVEVFLAAASEEINESLEHFLQHCNAKESLMDYVK